MAINIIYYLWRKFIYTDSYILYNVDCMLMIRQYLKARNQEIEDTSVDDTTGA